MFCTDPTTDAHLAPPQANPDAQPDTVGQRTQWADEVEAYARALQDRLDEMMGDALESVR